MQQLPRLTYVGHTDVQLAYICEAVAIGTVGIEAFVEAVCYYLSYLICIDNYLRIVYGDIRKEHWE